MFLFVSKKGVEMLKDITDKVTSARSLVVVMLVATLCYGFIVKIVPPEAFIPIVLVAVDWYFKRSDRRNGNGNV